MNRSSMPPSAQPLQAECREGTKRTSRSGMAYRFASRFLVMGTVVLAGCGGNSGGGDSGSCSSASASNSNSNSNSSSSSGGGGSSSGGSGLGLSLLAGNIGGPGNLNGTGAAARFADPGSVAADARGNLYVADSGNAIIRMITPAGVVTTLAGTPGQPGNADGVGSAALFFDPAGVAVDSSGKVYVADANNNKIRMISIADGVATVSTLAGTGASGSNNGPATTATFNGPTGVAVDSSGNIYVADSGNNTIRKISKVGGVETVSTLAGTGGQGSANGPAATASFNDLDGVAVDSSGNVYVADSGNNAVREISIVNGVETVSTLAGTGDQGGANGPATTATFNNPNGVAVDSSGNVYVADSGNNTIRQISKVNGVETVSTLAGTALVYGNADGTGPAAGFYYPAGIAVSSCGNVFVADSANDTIREITPAAVVTTVAGLAAERNSDVDGTGPAASFSSPWGVAVDAGGNFYVADSSNQAVRKITPAGVVTTLATGFVDPVGVAVDASGNVYVVDVSAHTIYEVTPAGAKTVLAGSPNFGSADGTGAAAQFFYPYGIAIDASGNLYVADSDNNTIRMITQAGVVTTVAGSPGQIGSSDGVGAAARFSFPAAIAIDASGTLYVADANNNTIRMITIQNGVGTVTTLAGSAGKSGSTDGTGTAALFSGPFGVAVDASGNVFVADTNNSTIRKLTVQNGVGTSSTVVGKASSSGIQLGALPGSLYYPLSIALNASGQIVLTSDNALLIVTGETGF